jgi:hypothetical protein
MSTHRQAHSISRLERRRPKSSRRSTWGIVVAREFLEIYPDQPSKAEALESYLEEYELAYRIPLLLSTGSIYVERGASGQVQRNGKSPVKPGDTVSRISPSTAYERAIGQVPATSFRDYVWVAMDDTAGLYVKQMIKLRAEGTRPDVIDAGAGIFDLETYFLRIKRPRKNSPLVTHPIRDIVIYSHAWASGWLHIPTGPGQSKQVDYEMLEAASRDATQKRYFDLSGDLFDPRPKNADGSPGRGPALHIRGCRLGKALPFLQLLKKLLGGTITITAPKHWMRVAPITGRMPGYYEHLAYSFNLLRAAKFRGPKDRELAAKEIASRPDSVHIDGSRVRAAELLNFIPKDPNQSRHFTAPFTMPFDSGTFAILVEYNHVEDYGFEIKELQTTEDLSQKKDLPSILKKILPTAKPQYSTNHPFPQWARLGLGSLDELVNSFKWEAEKNGATWTVRAFTNWYEVQIPVSVANKLPGNFFPSGPTGSVLLGLDEFDAKFYAVV